MTAEEHTHKVGPEDGQVLLNPIGGRMVLKVPDTKTAGAYSIHDNILPPHSPGPRPHLHRDHEETFYVLAGELTVRVGGSVREASPTDPLYRDLYAQTCPPVHALSRSGP